jgi:hypothetical protein
MPIHLRFEGQGTFRGDLTMTLFVDKESKLIQPIGAWATFVQAVIGSLLLMAFSIANGYPLFYFDSLAYVREPIIAIASITDLPLTSSWPNIHTVTRDGSQVRKGTEADSSEAMPPETGGEREYTPNRSIYYGFFTLLGYLAGGYWVTVFLQAFSVAYPTALFMIRCLRLDR